jgi:hypothetical protein
VPNAHGHAQVVLYVAGESPGSMAARQLVESLLDSGEYPGCTLTVIDTLRETGGLRDLGIVCVPALCLCSDGERRWFTDPLPAKERLVCRYKPAAVQNLLHEADSGFITEFY